MRDAAALGLGHDIMVQSVDEGSEGAAAELYVFDYVVAVEGVPVRDLEHLYSVLAALPVGQPASLDFLRAGTTEDEGRVFALLRREIIVTAPTHFGAWAE